MTLQKKTICLCKPGDYVAYRQFIFERGLNHAVCNCKDNFFPALSSPEVGPDCVSNSIRREIEGNSRGNNYLGDPASQVDRPRVCHGGCRG